MRTILSRLGLNYDAPLYSLSVGQYLELLNASGKQTEPLPQASKVYLYGLKGIQTEFGISHKTAQAWKNTWLAPAIEQKGKLILCDKELAHKLFNERRAAK